MLRVWLAATTVVAMMTGVAVAQTSSSVGATGPQQPGVGEPIMTSGGSAAVTRSDGSPAAAAIAGAGSHTRPTDGGNATTTMVPGQPPKLMSTPE